MCRNSVVTLRPNESQQVPYGYVAMGEDIRSRWLLQESEAAGRAAAFGEAHSLGHGVWNGDEWRLPQTCVLSWARAHVVHYVVRCAKEPNMHGSTEGPQLR